MAARFPGYSLRHLLASISCLVCAGLIPAASRANGDAQATISEISGLVLPRTKSEIIVRTSEGDVRVRLGPETRFGRAIHSWSNIRVDPNQLVAPDVTTPNPDDTAATTLPGTLLLLYPLNTSGWANVLGAGELRLAPIHFDLSIEPLTTRVPSEDDPLLIGTLVAGSGPDEWIALRVGDHRIPLDPVSPRRRFKHPTTLFGLGDADDIKPFVTKVRVSGAHATDAEGDFLLASAIAYEPMPDSTHFEDPGLPRLLVIGDSISGNYDAALRHALAGKVNTYHPGENAGGTAFGLHRIRTWLGAFDEPGRGWNVVAFNFGHWDDPGIAGPTRTEAKRGYQQRLEAIIAEIQRTGARLVWMTTTPVPRGFGAAEFFRPGKSALLNAWAGEVMARHDAISIVDLHAIVEADPRYAKWWERKDVHYTPSLAEPLGRAVAAGVLRALGRDAEEEINPPMPLSRAQVESQRCCLPDPFYRRLLDEAPDSPAEPDDIAVEPRSELLQPTP